MQVHDINVDAYADCGSLYVQRLIFLKVNEHSNSPLLRYSLHCGLRKAAEIAFWGQAVLRESRPQVAARSEA
jgi:hypothetical protein